MNEDEMQQDPEIEVSIVDDGSMLPDEEAAELNAPTAMDFNLAELLGEPVIEDEEDDPEEESFYRNLAEDLDEGALQAIAGELTGAYEDDLSSRKDWIQGYVEGLDLLGLKIENRTEPWAGACGVFHPVLTEAIVKFQAETMMSTFPPAGPVKTKIIGKETPERKKASQNVQDDMNFQLMEVMSEYRPEHERMLWGLGLSGNAFKKIYFDPGLDRQTALYIPAEDLVVPYGASNLESAERITHVMRKTKNEVRKLQVGGFYRDVDLGEPRRGNLDEIEKKIAESMGFSATTDDRFKILEMHVDLDLNEFDIEDAEAGEEAKQGVALPYIVTIEKSSNTVLSIYRNWAQEDEKKTKRQHFVHYPLVPGFGFYAFGYVHLLGSFAKSATSIMRQLVDAGTLSNLPGGFKTRGLRVKGDDTPISPGEFRDVDVASGTIKDNIMTLPYKEPSQTLFTLLQNIVEEGRKFASTTELNVSDMSAQAPVGTTLAILERSLKVMSAVQSRIHYALKKELKLLSAIIRDFTPDTYSYDPDQGDRAAKKSDYDMVEIIPVSDPNASTMAQKVTQYQAVMQLAQNNPQIYDMPELNRQMLEVLGIKNIGKLIPTSEEPKPRDPVSENLDLIAMKPVKAYIQQNHDAHITTHMSMLKDPKLAQLMQQNPQADAIGAALMAHVAEHMGFMYRAQIEEQLGVPLPPPDQPLPKDVEAQLSQLIAQAAQQLLQKNQAEAAQQQQQAEAQDPLNIIQKMQLQLEQQKVQMDAQLKQAELQLKGQVEQEKLALEREKLSLEAMKNQTQMAMKDKELSVKQMLEGVKIGAETSNRRADRQHQQTAKVQDRAHQTAQAARSAQAAQFKQPPTKGEKGEK